MATTNQNPSAPNKVPLFQRYGGLPKESPQSVTPQNFKSNQIQTTKAEAILLDTAKTSTKSQQGLLGAAANRQILTLQNSQIHGRKVDSPKIYVNESDLNDTRPKTSAQCSRRNKIKRKVSQVATPANNDKKIKTFKKEKNGGNQKNQSTSGSCLTIFPAQPESGRRQKQRFDFQFDKDNDQLEAGALPSTEREVIKRNKNSNIIADFPIKESFNNSTAQLGISKYQQSRQHGKHTSAKSVGVTNKPQRSRQLSQSMQLGANLVKAHLNSSLLTPQQNQNPANFNQNQQPQVGVKTVKQQRQPKFTDNQQAKCNETSRGRQTRSSDQKSKPSLAAASKKSMLMKKQKTQKPVMIQNFTSKSAHGNLRYKLQQTHLIESQNKFKNDGEGRNDQFSFDLDNKENYHSNSSLQNGGKSKPLSEKSKSVSASRSRKNGGGGRLHNDLSLSSLSRSSRNLKVEASGGSLSKMLGKQYFLDGEHMLKLLSPVCQPQKSETHYLQHERGDARNFSNSRANSPQKYTKESFHKQKHHKLKSEDAVQCSIDSKCGELRQIKIQATQMTSLGDLTSTKAQQKIKKGQNDKTYKQKNAQELLRKFMEETQRKTDREVRAKDSENARIQEILSKNKQKKKRSKSCISKIGEGVFSAREQNRERSKESANKTCLFSEGTNGNYKKHQVREPSCLVELNNLKREINQEMRRERFNGAEVPRTVVTPQAAKPQITSTKNRFDPRKQSAGGQSGIHNYTSLRLNETNKNIIANQLQDPQSKNDKRNSEINHKKIQKYIERQKRMAQVKKSMKETIEHEKHIKVKETLFELQKFNKKKRSGSLNKTAQSMNANNINTDDHQRNHQAEKKLKVNHTKLPRKKKSTQINGPMQDFYQNESKQDYNANQQNSGGRYQHEDLYQLQEESAIIDIFRKELSSSKSNSVKNKDTSPVGSDVEYPLKELFPKLGQAGQKSKKSRVTNIQTIPIAEPYHSMKDQSNTKTNLGHSEFESIEPSRNPTEDKSIKNQTRSTPKQNLTIYDKSEIGTRKNKDFNIAAIQIQKIARGYLSRKRLQFKNSKKSSPAQQTEHNNTAQSIKKTMNIPSLNLQKINSTDSNNPYQMKPKHQQQHEAQSSSARSSSIFDHNSFQHRLNKPLLPQDDMSSLPELIKIREEAIKIREEQEQKKLQQQLNQNKVSPRTFKRKQLELEVWVTKETNKINRDKESYEGKGQRDRNEQYLKNVFQDNEQIKQILGSARSSQKLNKLPQSKDCLLASSAREGINSFRVESQRKSHRVDENRLIDLIYDKKQNDKVNNESSSQSRKNQNLKVKSVSQQSSSHQNSNSVSQSQQSQSYRSQYDDYGNLVNEDDDIPDFAEIHVQTQTKNQLDDRQPEPIRNTEQQNKITKDAQAVQEPKVSPRILNKNDGRAKLHDNLDDEEAELTRLVMEVSPAVSQDSKSNLRQELKEALHSENFFKEKMEDKDSGANDLNIYGQRSANIRIEIGDERNPEIQHIGNTLIGTISPLSGASSDFGIQRGSMSLESSTSNDNRDQLHIIIDEIKQEVQPVQQPDPHIHQSSLTPQQAEFAENLTQEIMQLLVAEMRMDFELLVNRDAAQIMQQQQDQMNMQQLQGIKTDLFAIEKYVDEIVEEIKVNSPEFLKILNTPLAKNNIQLLNQLQNTEIGSCEHFDENFPQILPLDLYLTLEKRRKETRERKNQEENPNSVPGSQTEMLRVLIAECEHIHNKVLFDCINDSLLQFKPYGKEGEPLPWSRKNRRLKPTDDFSVTEIFEIVKHDLFRWAITQAGTLPRREFVYRGVFDEELFSEIREKKLVALLAREMVETEPRWLNYEFEQAQVKIDVGDMILEMLVTETIAIIKQNEENQQVSADNLQSSDSTGRVNEPIARGQRNLELYEAHILNDIGVGGNGNVRRQREISQDQSGYNSKDSDFSNNDEGSLIAEDFGGNQSHDDSNYHDDEF